MCLSDAGVTGMITVSVIIDIYIESYQVFLVEKETIDYSKKEIPRKRHAKHKFQNP